MATEKSEGVQNCAIANMTKGKAPNLPFVLMKEAVLGKKYDLSIVFSTAPKMRVLNKKYRQKDRPTDILSFPLSKNHGEIFICPSETKREAKKFARLYENFLGFLLIHGLTHLKGLRHGKKMDTIETMWRKKFKI